MPILFLSADLCGYGGVQYFGRMALDAVCEGYGATTDIHLVTRMDTPEGVAENGFRGSSFAAAGNLRKFVVRAMAEMYRRSWDVVILSHINLARLLPLCPTQPTVCVIYGIEVWRRLSWPTRRGLSSVHRVVSISDHSLRQATEHNPWMAKLSTGVCHLGVPTVATASDPTPLPGGPYILSIGRMVSEERYKGFDELIRIWNRVRAVRPELRLLLMGDGPDRPRLERLTREQSVVGVEFLGRVSDADRDRYLRHCEAFALPSRGEGFGLVYLEAMRVGRPVLTGDTDAGAEVIVDRVTGRAVPPTNPDALVDGLLDVAGVNSRRYGEAGRKRFEDRFTYPHFRERFLAEVNTVMRNPPARATSQVGVTETR